MERWVLWRLVPSVGLVIIALASCTSFFMGGNYAYFYRISQPADANGMSWEDQKIATQFSVGDKGISFKILNETKESIKVIWDEVTIVQYNKVLRVMHEGVRYVDRGNSQPPSNIPPGAYLEDFAVPVENIYYSEGWETSDLFPTNDLNKAEFKDNILKSVGQTVALNIPVDLGGEKTVYSFTFEIVSVFPVGSPK